MWTAFCTGAFWANCTKFFFPGSFGKLYDLDFSKFVRMTVFFSLKG